MAKAPVRAQRKKRLSVFLSYASEDKALVEVVEAKLRKTFVGRVDVRYDNRINAGDDYRDDIENWLETTDVLIALLTDKKKTSHSYTGFEIGYFKRSIQSRSSIIPGVDRIVIPFCIGAEVPDTMHYVEGVKINEEDVFQISGKVISSQIPAGLVLQEENPAYRLLKRIFDIVKKIAPQEITEEDVTTINQNMTEAADELYKRIIEYLQNRVSSKTLPERKIIIHADKRPDASPDGAVLDGTSVELVGDSFEVFGFAEDQIREFVWPEFIARMPQDAAAKWAAGIRGLVSAVIHRSGENYMVVTGRNDKGAFRLFVSQVITYVNNKTNIEIYFVEMRTPTYGDQMTTRLSKAIDVGLRFRFLVLEDSSKFRPDDLAYTTNDYSRLKPLITEMLGQMDLILKDAKDADLEDPQMLKLIYGEGSNEKVRKLIATWKDTYSQLTSTANAVLDSEINQFADKKDAFIKALRTFCGSTNAMNVDYTSGVMKALSAIISGQVDRVQKVA